MAYVATRRDGRYEIRESVHTPRGPRARSLAGFAILTDDVIARAARRATRSFDAAAVIASGRRAGAPVEAVASAMSSRQFVEASRRMASSLRRSPASGRGDPGQALVDLLGFADAVTSSHPARPLEPLEFPVLSRLVEDRGSTTRPR